MDPRSNNRGNDPPSQNCMVNFGPDIGLLHCGTNDFKKELIPQKNTQNILKLAKDVSDGSKRDVLVTEIINRGDDFNFHAKMHRVNEFLPEIRTRKNAKYLDNGNIGLGMLNRSKLYLNRFGAIQLIKNYRDILKV